MGWEEIDNTQVVDFRKLWGGWFPGKSHNEIPGRLDDSEPMGFVEASNSVWIEGRLSKMFGYNNLTTSALNGGATVTSLYYSPVLSDMVGTAGNKIYSDMDAAVPADITGAVTVTAGLSVRWTEWQFTTTKYVIGANGTDAPWKWTGAGNASLLGGTPPVGQWIAVFQNALWTARTAAQPSTLFFSSLGDPEVYSANDNYKFDAPITGLGVLGNQLVVFMDDHIGIVSGTNNRQLTKVDNWILGVGCSSGHSIANGKINNVDVLIFHSYDGICLYDGSRAVTKVSGPIQRKYTSASSGDRWNEARLNEVVGAYYPKYGWYAFGISDSGSSVNNVLMILDLARPFQTNEGINVPHWPQFDVKNVSALETNWQGTVAASLYLGSTDGFVYKFDPALFNRDGVGYTSYVKSKILDLVNQSMVQEVNLLGGDIATSSTITTFINMDLSEGDGESGSVDLALGDDQLDIDFIMDTSELGGSNFAFVYGDVMNFGRWLQFKVQNSTLDEQMDIQGLNFVFNHVGVDPNIQLQ